MSNLIFPSTLSSARLVTREEIEDDAQIDTSLSKRETRYTWSTYPRYRYEYEFSALRSATAYLEYQKVLGFRGRHRGQLDSFLLVDPEDNSVTAHPFGVGDGATTSFQLQRTVVASADLNPAATRAYWPTMGDDYQPVFDLNGNPSIFKDTGGGPVLQVLGTDYTLPGVGVVTFAVAPAANAILTWTGSYYRRVRFEDPTLPTSKVVTAMWTAKVKLISVKPTEALPQTVPPQFTLTPITDSSEAGTLTGAINGTTGSDGNATFTLRHTPADTNIVVLGDRNGQKLTKGVDFTVAGNVITMISPEIPRTGDSLSFTYFYTV